MSQSGWRALFACLVLLPVSSSASAALLRVAVASNFTVAAEALAERFEAQTGHSISLVSGSSGKHYAQIINGAPYDVFLAAEARRPALLENAGVAVAGSRFSYALGQLVLWSPRIDYVDDQGDVLKSGEFRYLAIANPRLAPYGQAARQVLQAFGRWEALRGRIVRGENVAQAYQYVKSGNAELGFVGLAQILGPGSAPGGSYWVVPADLYTPIEQQAVLLQDTAVARSFVEFLQSDTALAIIRDYGYNLP